MMMMLEELQKICLVIFMCLEMVDTRLHLIKIFDVCSFFVVSFGIGCRCDLFCLLFVRRTHTHTISCLDMIDQNIIMISKAIFSMVQTCVNSSHTQVLKDSHYGLPSTGNFT